MSPQTGSCRYTHTYLNRFLGALVFSIFFIVGIFIFYFLAHCRPFYLFTFFFRVHKKHKNANKRISNFFLTQMFFKRIFFFFVRLFAFSTFVWLRFCAFCTFCAFLYFLVLVKSFRKKKKKK